MVVVEVVVVVVVAGPGSEGGTPLGACWVSTEGSHVELARARVGTGGRTHEPAKKDSSLAPTPAPSHLHIHTPVIRLSHNSPHF